MLWCFVLYNVHKTDAYGVFEGKFGDGSAEAGNLAEAFFAGDQRRKQGCVPDIHLEPHEVPGIRIVEKPTLFELKQVNLVHFYYQVNAWKNHCHAVQRRADSGHDDYLKALHNADRAAGTPCPHALLASRKCARGDNNLPHGVGGGEAHLLAKFRIVNALVFGHFGEVNDGLMKLRQEYLPRAWRSSTTASWASRARWRGARARRRASCAASRWSRSARRRATCCAGSPS